MFIDTSFEKMFQKTDYIFIHYIGPLNLLSVTPLWMTRFFEVKLYPIFTQLSSSRFGFLQGIYLASGSDFFLLPRECFGYPVLKLRFLPRINGMKSMTYVGFSTVPFLLVWIFLQSFTFASDMLI